MIPRAFIIGIELLGGLLAVVVIAFVTLFWRLSTGPIPLDYATPYIERALSTDSTSLEAKIQNTELVWAGWGDAFDIRIYNAAILGSGGKILATLPEASVGFSVPALFRGLIAPTHLEVYGLSASVERAEDGRIAMGFFAGKDEAADREFADNIPGYIAKFSEPGDLESAFGYLDAIRVMDVDLRYSDLQTGAKWHAPETNIELIREADGLEAIASMGLDFGERRSRLRAHAVFSPDRPVIDIAVDLDEFYPSDLAARLPEISILKSISMPISGQVRVSAQHTGVIGSVAFDLKGAVGSFAGNVIVNTENEYDLTVNLSGVRLNKFSEFLPELTNKVQFEASLDARASGQISSFGKVRNLEMHVETGAGLVHYASVLPNPIQFDGIKFDVKTENALSRVIVSNFEARLGKTLASLDVSAHRIGDELRARLNGTASNIDMATLDKLWPTSLGVEARKWVTTNIRKGIVDKASLKLVTQTPMQMLDGLRIQSLSGGLEFRDLEVAYFDGFPKVRNIEGTATFTRDRLDLDVARGSLIDLDIDNGVVQLSQLDTDQERISIDLVARGPLATTLSLANRKPLGFVGEVGIDPAAVGGEMVARLGFRFPLRADVKLNQVNVVGATNMRGVSMNPGPFGFQLSNSDLELKLSNKVLKVGGRVEMNGVPLSVNWHEDFVASEDFRSRYILSGELGAPEFSRLGLPDMPFFGGRTETNLIVSRFGDGRTEVLGSGNLNDVVLSVPEIGWIKPAGQPGTVRFGMTSLADGSARIDRFDLIAGDMEAIGKLDFEGGNFRRWKADFSKFKVGKTDIRGQVSQLSDGEFLVRLDGSRLDIEPLLIGDQREGREVTRNAVTETKQIYIDMNVDSLRTGPGFGLGRTEGQMRLIGREIDMLSLDAGLGDGKSLQINYAPSEAGHALKIRSNDAGATLRMLGWSDKLEGGELSVTGQRRGQDEPLSGSFKLSDYKLTKAPALARLLQVASLTGIFDALQSGLEFVAFDGTFAYSNKLLRVERSRAYGSSIGITVEGALDLEEDIAELKGTVVPAYTVNRVLGQIPILGPILTGGENEGVFAASYAVNGPLEDPAIAVNPLSALAPGFLRKLFDAIGGDTEPSPSAAPEKQEN